MEQELKPKDLVRIASVRYSPEMIISKIDAETQVATCTWYDIKARKTKTELIPVNVLELVPPKPSLHDIVEAVRR